MSGSPSTARRQTLAHAAKRCTPPWPWRHPRNRVRDRKPPVIPGGRLAPSFPERTSFLPQPTQDTFQAPSLLLLRDRSDLAPLPAIHFPDTCRANAAPSILSVKSREPSPPYLKGPSSRRDSPWQQACSAGTLHSRPTLYLAWTHVSTQPLEPPAWPQVPVSP